MKKKTLAGVAISVVSQRCASSFVKKIEYITFSFFPVFPDSSAVLGRSWMVEPEDSESSREEADKLEGLCRECGFRAEKR